MSDQKAIDRKFPIKSDGTRHMTQAELDSFGYAVAFGLITIIDSNGVSTGTIYNANGDGAAPTLLANTETIADVSDDAGISGGTIEKVSVSSASYELEPSETGAIQEFYVEAGGSLADFTTTLWALPSAGNAEEFRIQNNTGSALSFTAGTGYTLTTLDGNPSEAQTISIPNNVKYVFVLDSDGLIKTLGSSEVSQAELDAHTTDTANPHAVTATQVGLGNCDNTADLDKPISTATQTALDLKADDADLTSHTGNTSNPHIVTATQVGLGNCDNTADLDKPISTATQMALDLKADDADLTSHTGNTSNPHVVTATQVGLGNCDNTADLDKPISTATQTALDLKADDADLTSHTGDTSNPHIVTATQVGLGNCDNTADADKPVSTAQQTALDLKADDADLTSHTGDTSNPHVVTATQVGLGNCDNTADADKPVSTAQQTALDLKADDADLTSHTGNTSNPHIVTATQVGLGNCDNTSDANKPVSTATQTALDLKANIASPSFTGDVDTTATNGKMSMGDYGSDLAVHIDDGAGNLDAVLSRDISEGDIYVGDIVANGGKVYIRANGGTKVTVLENGNVGIGELSPDDRLHVNSNAAGTTAIAKLESSDGDVELFVTNATPESTITGNAGDLAVDATNAKLYIKTDNGDATDWAEMGQRAQYLRAQSTANQTSNISATDPILFNATDVSSGSAISLNTGTGIFTLAAGYTYELTGSAGWCDGSSYANATFRWRDLTNATLIGNGSHFLGDAGSTSEDASGVSHAIITPATQITVQLEITDATDLTQIGDTTDTKMPWAMIKTI